MTKAFDVLSPVTAGMIPAIRAAGIEAIARYTRNITIEEAQLICGAGINLVMVAEWGGNRYDYFTDANGTRDAARALEEVAAIGMPRGNSGIYFCGADFDASNEDIAGGIDMYMRAVKTGLTGSGRGLGVYGNGAVCRYMLDHGIAEKAWVWAGSKTNGTQEFVDSERWSIRQHPTTTMFGTSVDPDDLNGDYWGFRIDVPDKAAVWPPSRFLRLGDNGDDVRELQRRIGGLRVDGIFGRATLATVRAYQRELGVAVDGIVGPITSASLSGPEHV